MFYKAAQVKHLDKGKPQAKQRNLHFEDVRNQRERDVRDTTAVRAAITTSWVSNVNLPEITAPQPLVVSAVVLVVIDSQCSTAAVLQADIVTGR